MKTFLLLLIVILIGFAGNMKATETDTSNSWISIGIVRGWQIDYYGWYFTDFGAFAGYSYFKTETSVSYEYSIGSNNGTGGYSETNHAVNINFFYYPFRKRLFNISTGIYSGVIFTEREPVYDLVPFDFVREEPVRKTYFQAGFHLGLFLIVPPTKGSGLFFNFKIPVVQPGYGAVQLGLRLNLPY